MTARGLRLVQGGGESAALEGLVDIAGELARAGTLAMEARDTDDAAGRASYLREARRRVRAALAKLEALDA